jgi:hypothetical protein
MIASQEKTLQPLASIPVEQAAAQERPVRSTSHLSRCFYLL